MIFFQPPAIGWDIFHFIRLLRAASNFEHFQRQSIHMGNLLLGYNICILKNLLLISNLNLPSFYVKLIPLVLSLGPGKKSFSIFLLSSLYYSTCIPADSSRQILKRVPLSNAEVPLLHNPNNCLHRWRNKDRKKLNNPICASTALCMKAFQSFYSTEALGPCMSKNKQEVDVRLLPSTLLQPPLIFHWRLHDFVYSSYLLRSTDLCLISP